jgi:uncharacterized protein YggU (UPF0235/DUF167 family)
VRKSAVAIVRGDTARHKEIAIAGVGIDDVVARLAAAD